MANKWQVIGIALIITAAFFAGGWFFNRVTSRDVRNEVESLYQKDGASVGIFDRVPPEDMAVAQQIADEALYAVKPTLPEDNPEYHRQDGQDLPTQVAHVEWKDIAGVAPKRQPIDKPAESLAGQPPVPQKSEVYLNGNEVAAIAAQTVAVVDSNEPSHITMITAPVRFFLIRNLEEYKAFKQQARGGYPTVDFAKQMLVVLESDSNFPNNAFEIVSADKQDGALVVSYRVNVLGLDKKINSHSVLLVEKTPLPVELKQVL